MMVVRGVCSGCAVRSMRGVVCGVCGECGWAGVASVRVCVRGGGVCGVEVAFFFCCEEQREREGEMRRA